MNSQPDSADRSELPLEGLIRTIHDVRPPIEEDALPWVAFIAALLFLLLAALLIKRLLLSRKVRADQRQATPYQTARANLMAAHDLLPEIEATTFAERLSSAVRGFLGGAFALPAPEQTTDEIIASIRDHPVLQGSLADSIASLLRQCDAAKFARHPIDQKGKEQLYLLADAIVDRAHLAAIREESSPAAATERVAG